MKVVGVAYGEFPGIYPLNTHFRPGSKKLVVRIEAIFSSEVYQEAYGAIIQRFKRRYPNLKKHACGDKPLNLSPTINKPPGEYFLEICHLVEHVIIEILCARLPVRCCSGISCLTKTEKMCNIFVECDSQEIVIDALVEALMIVLRIIKKQIMRLK